MNRQAIRSTARVAIIGGVIGIHVFMIVNALSDQAQEHEIRPPDSTTNVVVRTRVEVSTETDAETSESEPEKEVIVDKQPEKETQELVDTQGTKKKEADKEPAVPVVRPPVKEAPATAEIKPTRITEALRQVKEAKQEAGRQKAMRSLYHAHDGQYIPELQLRIEDMNVHRQALRAFGFSLLARPRDPEDFYFEKRPDGNILQKRGECPHAGWCLDSLPGDESFFWKQAKAEGLEPSQLEMFYKSLNGQGEAYLRGVSLKAIYDAGLTPDDTTAIIGQLTRDSGGRFAVEVERIVAK